MPSTVLLVSLLATTLALCRHSYAQSSAGIFFMPRSNQTVPSSSFDNVTYNCEVDANRILIWEVNMIPLEDNDSVMQFEAIGVFKVDQGTNQSTLIITRDAREEYSWQPISVRCSAFTRMPPQTDYSSFSYVITQYDGILFTPTSNQTVSSNSFDNVTYNCEVDANRILIWEVNIILLEDNDSVMQFEAIGVFKVDQGTNQSTLIITRDAREEYSWQPISVRCSAFTRMPPQTDYSSFSYVITQYVVDCGTLTNPDNGTVNHTAGTTIGELATYSCNMGFNLVGNNTQTCQAAGWSESAPTCQIVDCGALSNPVNGSVHYTAGTTFGQKANYSCNTGYRLVGDSTQTCQATGRWSGSVPTCHAVSCSTLTNLTNGSVSHTAGTAYGQTATYSCNTGYNLVGNSTRTCQATRMWSGSEPTCQVVNCDTLADPTNGQVSHTAGTTYGQTAIYSCNTGYSLVGSSIHTCQVTGDWSGNSPTCQVVDCGALTNPANGQVIHTQSGGTTYGQTATYSCNTGYNLVGNSTRTCQATGMWSGSEPTCQAVNCDTLADSTNGRVSHTGGTTFGQTANYSCNTGYRLVGDNIRTCQATGEWSGSVPTCHAVDCGTLTNPASGHVSHFAGTTFGQTATYSCDAGYSLVGDNTRTCQATGVWSGSAPTCHTTVANVGELSTSDEGLSTGHIIGISFGILGLVVTIIVPVSIALIKHYIHKQHTEREPNSNGRVIPNPMVAEQEIAGGSMDQQDPMVAEQGIAGGSMDQQDPMVEEQEIAGGSMDQQDAQSLNVNGETPATIYNNEGAEDDARSLNVNGETPATVYYNAGAEDVAQICKVDGDTLKDVDSHQYESLEVYRKQHKQPKEQIPLKPVLQYHNPSATFKEETSFHSSDDSN